MTNNCEKERDFLMELWDFSQTCIGNIWKSKGTQVETIKSPETSSFLTFIYRPVKETSQTGPQWQIPKVENTLL